VGLLGPNGSGKSTLLKVMLGLLAPTAGQCRVFGVPSDRVEARRGVGFLPEAPEFSPHMTGFELVRFHARLGGMARTAVKARVEEVIAGVGLEKAMHRRVGGYSKGMRQRIGLAQALVLDPQLLILDEPTCGIDRDGAAEISAMIRRVKMRGGTVVLSSHLAGQVEDLCDRAVLLDRGRLILQGSVEELTRGRGQACLVVDALRAGTLGELRGWLQAHGVGFHGMETPRLTLERVIWEQVDRGRRTGAGEP
jgi:ABC-2 type transport system ATP-binding protein